MSRKPESEVVIHDDGQGVTVRESGGRVSLVIEGAAYENLVLAAKVFNEWDGNDLTPGEFLWSEHLELEDWLTVLGSPLPQPKKAFFQTLAGLVCDIYQGEADVGRLRRAFEGAGLSLGF